MLRITVHDHPRSLTFQLEGSLAGPWLRELEECWQNALSGEPKPVPRAVARAARLSIFGLIGWFWFLSGGDSTRKIILLIAVLGFAALVAITWYASRARADRRWRAALDRYAQQEQAKETHSRRRHRG